MQNETPTTAPAVLDHALLRLGVLTVLQSRVAGAVDAARTEVHGLTKKGETHVVTHPDDAALRIGTVSHSTPKAKATVTGQRELDAWILANYPAKTETTTKVTGSSADVLDVLREHAPWLVEDVTEVPAWARNELTTKSAAVGEPIGYGGEMGEHAPPGITVTAPDGVLRVLPAKNAVDVVDQLWLDQRVDLDGNLLELTAGDAA